MIKYDHEHVKRCSQQDYLGPSPIFNNHKFQQIFHISQGMYDCITNEIKDHEFCDVGDYDVTGHPTTCTDTKMLISWNHLGYGCAADSWIDYFQMGESTGCFCVETLCKCIAAVFCMSNACDCTQKQMQTKSQNSMSLFMEF